MYFIYVTICGFQYQLKAITWYIEHPPTSSPSAHTVDHAISNISTCTERKLNTVFMSSARV